MARRENDYLIDRDMQKNVNYTGIQGIGRQDQAMIECMGEIVDRSLEHLAPSDRMIAITRKRLLQAAQELMNEKKVPATVDNPDIYLGARGGAFVAPDRDGLARRLCRQAADGQEPANLLERLPWRPSERRASGCHRQPTRPVRRNGSEATSRCLRLVSPLAKGLSAPSQ